MQTWAITFLVLCDISVHVTPRQGYCTTAFDEWAWCYLSMTATDADDGEKKVELKPIECYSCKVISDGLCFVLPGYLLYHTYKNRPLLNKRQRIRLYIANGLLAAGKWPNLALVIYLYYVLFLWFISACVICTSPMGVVVSMVMSMSVCVLLSVCLRGYLWYHTHDLYRIVMNVAYGRGFFLLRHCDTSCTSGFVDDITFFCYSGPYSGTNFATKDQFHLNLLIYCKVGQFIFLLLNSIIVTNYFKITCKLKWKRNREIWQLMGRITVLKRKSR